MALADEQRAEPAPMKRGPQALLASDPWLRGLTSPGEDRIERFVNTEHELDGVPARVVELTGKAGDLVLAHPWLLHTSAPNCRTHPRLMRVRRLHVGEDAPTASRSRIGSMKLLVLLCATGLAPTATAQSYDFNGLTGSDTYPYTDLDGQDNWTEQTFNAPNPCGVTQTLSHDGSQSLQFQDVGAGYGTDASRINDGAWSFPAFTGAEADAFFQADVLVGYWGGTFGPAHDTNGNGMIRGSEAGERGVRFVFGTHANVQLQLVDVNGVGTTAQLAPLGISGGNWIRLRAVLDLNGGGLGSVEFMNITAGDTAFQPVAALQNVPLGLAPGATDATDATNWDALWLHFEGATYGLDNVVFGELAIGTGYCNPAVSNSTGLPALLGASGSDVLAANDVNFVVSQLPLNQFGYFVMGQTQGFISVGQGFLCMSLPFVRFSQNILDSGGAGVMQFAPDLVNLPSGTVFAVGDTWNFQCWYRDLNPGNTSNLSGAVSITFL